MSAFPLEYFQSSRLFSVNKAAEQLRVLFAAVLAKLPPAAERNTLHRKIVNTFEAILSEENCNKLSSLPLQTLITLFQVVESLPAKQAFVIYFGQLLDRGEHGDYFLSKWEILRPIVLSLPENYAVRLRYLDLVAAQKTLSPHTLEACFLRWKAHMAYPSLPTESDIFPIFQNALADLAHDKATRMDPLVQSTVADFFAFLKVTSANIHAQQVALLIASLSVQLVPDAEALEGLTPFEQGLAAYVSRHHGPLTDREIRFLNVIVPPYVSRRDWSTTDATASAKAKLLLLLLSIERQIPSIIQSQIQATSFEPKDWFTLLTVGEKTYPFLAWFCHLCPPHILNETVLKKIPKDSMIQLLAFCQLISLPRIRAFHTCFSYDERVGTLPLTPAEVTAYNAEHPHAPLQDAMSIALRIKTPKSLTEVIQNRRIPIPDGHTLHWISLALSHETKRERRPLLHTVARACYITVLKTPEQKECLVRAGAMDVPLPVSVTPEQHRCLLAFFASYRFPAFVQVVYAIECSPDASVRYIVSPATRFSPEDLFSSLSPEQQTALIQRVLTCFLFLEYLGIRNLPIDQGSFVYAGHRPPTSDDFDPNNVLFTPLNDALRHGNPTPISTEENDTLSAVKTYLGVLPPHASSISEVILSDEASSLSAVFETHTGQKAPPEITELLPRNYHFPRQPYVDNVPETDLPDFATAIREGNLPALTTMLRNRRLDIDSPHAELDGQSPITYALTHAQYGVAERLIAAGVLFNQEIQDFLAESTRRFAAQPIAVQRQYPYLLIATRNGYGTGRRPALKYCRDPLSALRKLGLLVLPSTAFTLSTPLSVTAAPIYPAAGFGTDVVIKTLPTHWDHWISVGQELKWGLRAAHPNTVCPMAVVRFPDGVIGLVMPQFQNDLHETRIPISLRTFTDLAWALAYFFCSGLTHRDIKAKNTLCDAIGKLFLCDFATVMRLKSALKPPYAGTWGHVHPNDHERLSPDADLWAFMIVIAYQLDPKVREVAGEIHAREKKRYGGMPLPAHPKLKSHPDLSRIPDPWKSLLEPCKRGTDGKARTTMYACALSFSEAAEREAMANEDVRNHFSAGAGA